MYQFYFFLFFFQSLTGTVLYDLASIGKMANSPEIFTFLSLLEPEIWHVFHEKYLKMTKTSLFEEIES